MNRAECVKAVDEAEKYFNKSTSALEEADSAFTPAEGMFTAAQQVAEAAVTLNWFVDGTFSGNGWNMNFEEHQAEVRGISSLAAAREKLAQAFENVKSTISAQSEEQLNQSFPADDPIMPGAKKYNIVQAITDHTAHHRGALTVYTRLLGKTPPMPYM